MGRTQVSFNNRDLFIQLGITIATVRKLRGMSQDELALKAGISRSHLSAIEAAGIVRGVSLNTLFNIAQALNASASDMLKAAEYPELLFTLFSNIAAGK